MYPAYTACAQDFRELMIHHFITITLLSVSWANNNVRVGTLVLVSHDVNDIILEGGKMLKYLKKETVCDVLFALFLLSWLVTRLIYFPVAYVPHRSSLTRHFDSPLLSHPSKYAHPLHPPLTPPRPVLYSYYLFSD